ncbi:cytochrome P450 [Aspergillus carlsbadensis]|nr:cytochrome P450 [Aspergillus carlsbadensis]
MNPSMLLRTLVSITAVRSLQPIQEAESTLTIHQVAHSPARYYDHIRRYSTGVILSSVFGIRGPDFDHPNITRLYHVQDQFTARLPDAISPWRRWARRIRREQRQLYFELLRDAKDRLARGVRRDCFMDQLLDESFRGKYGLLDDEHVAYIGGFLMEGGSDTTASTLLSFLLAMVKYPRVFRKAQGQVDRLPYVKHCVSEKHIFNRVADDEYKGYRFPAGTTFLANAWAIHNDSELYDKPDEFLPERYEQSPLGFKPDVTDATEGLRKTYAFGAERRICPGSHLAESSLAFNISPGIDQATGRLMRVEDVNVDIATQWTDGFLIAPKPFPIRLSLRSGEHRAVLDRELEAAQAVFDCYEN